MFRALLFFDAKQQFSPADLKLILSNIIMWSFHRTWQGSTGPMGSLMSLSGQQAGCMQQQKREDTSLLPADGIVNGMDRVDQGMSSIRTLRGQLCTP